MKKKRASPTTPTSGGTTPTSNPFSWSPGYKPKGKECDPFGGYKEHYATLPKQYPTIFEYSSETHARTLRVKAMRKSIGHAGYVGHLLGYRPDAILAFERGYDRDGKALPEKKWKRYTWALIGLYLVCGYMKGGGGGGGEETRREDAKGDARGTVDAQGCARQRNVRVYKKREAPAKGSRQPKISRHKRTIDRMEVGE